MAATLTASDNPVAVWGKGQTGETVITWDTGSAAPARLYLQTAFTPVPPPAVLFDGDPTNGDLKGKKVLPVTVGPTYTLILRQVSDNAVLAMLQVTVDDLVQDLIDRAAQQAQFSGFVPIQAISNVVIQAGADDAHITFKTSQPTIPIVTATAPDGSSAAAFPVLNGMRTDHEVKLGVARPLEQLTTYALTITAAGTVGYPSHSITKVATASFTTGNRSVTVMIDAVKMLQGSGDFTLQFSAVDADRPEGIIIPWPIDQDHFEVGDRPHLTRYPMAIPNRAPRRLWVGGTCAQFSGSLDPLSSPSPIETLPYSNASPTGYIADDRTALAWVNAVYDITNGGSPIVDLVSRAADITFEMHGQITATVTPGTTPKLPKLQGSLSKSGYRLLDGGAKAGLTGPKGKKMTVARAADGAVYRRIKSLTTRMADDEGWVALTPPVQGAVTALATGADRIACFALDAEGHVQRADAKGEHPAGEWRRLGGGLFAGAAAAVASGDAIVLVAQDREGTIFERRVPEASHVDAGDWHKIGSAQLGTVTVRALHGHDVAVFALDRDGQAITRRRDAWHAISGATGITLGVSEIAHDAVGLALIDAAGKLHSLVWRGFPDREPGRWTSEGDFQEWLVRPLDAPEEARARASAAE